MKIMSIIEEGIGLWSRLLLLAVLLIVPSYLVISLWVGGEVMTATGNEAAGSIINVVGDVISKATTFIGNLLIAIIVKPITIILWILFVIYMKYRG